MQRKRIPWWWTDIGQAEVRRVAQAIRDRHINRGPVCQELESRLAKVLGVPHVVLTSSGSTALLMSLLACGVSPGDEVILPAETFIAGAHAALLLGAKVRLVDVLPDRPLIDPARIQAAITPRTRVVLPVHLNGMACDVAAVKSVADEHGLRVVEDAAQAFASGADGQPAGTLGDLGAFSMGITKLITTGEGGFVATRSPGMYDKLLRLRNHGTRAIADNRFDELGFNFRMTDLQAAMGMAQLQRLQEKISAHAALYTFYQDAVADLHYLRLIPVHMERGEIPLWICALCSQREQVIALLAERDIEARPFHPCLADSRHLDATGGFPNARLFADHGMTLPSGPGQPEANLQRVADALHEVSDKIETSIDSVLAEAR